MDVTQEKANSTPRFALIFLLAWVALLALNDLEQFRVRQLVQPLHF